jgi:hypothetical protein
MDKKKSLSCSLSGSEVEGDRSAGRWREEGEGILPVLLPLSHPANLMRSVSNCSRKMGCLWKGAFAVDEGFGV